jgi:DNA polymerase
MNSRVRLWLRSERAFGLNSVRRSNVDEANVSDTNVHEEIESGIRDTEDVSPAVKTETRARADVATATREALFAEVAKPNEMAPRGGLIPPTSAEPFEAPALASDEKKARLTALQNNEVRDCTKCRLCKSRTNTVFGEGDVDAKIVFIGEGPGENEDLQGRPFVGRAGQLLTKIIETMGFKRSDVYIANVLKCRPDMPRGSSGNRPPTPGEMETCLPYLTEQIEIIRPKVMVALGKTAVQGLLGTCGPMREMRGRWHSHQETPLMITYHPSYLLRDQSLTEKRKVWEDMLQVMERLGRPVTEKQRNYFRG